jgi:hypothetical protein
MSADVDMRIPQLVDEQEGGVYRDAPKHGLKSGRAESGLVLGKGGSR